MQTADFLPNVENVFALGQGSGGVIVQENTDDQLREYKLTDERLKAVKHEGEQMYKAVSEYYVPDVNSPSRDLTLDLAAPIRQQLLKAMILSPRFFSDCSPKSP